MAKTNTILVGIIVILVTVVPLCGYLYIHHLQYNALIDWKSRHIQTHTDDLLHRQRLNDEP